MASQVRTVLSSIFPTQLCLLGFFVFPAIAADPAVIPFHLGGEATKRTNIVFLGDGYTADMQGTFLRIVGKTVEEMKKVEPFAGYMDHFNIQAIWTPSVQKGVSKGQDKVDTYFGTEVGSICARSDNTITGPLLSRLVPDWTVAILFYRDEKRLGNHTCAARIVHTPDRWDGNPASFDGQEQVNVVLHEFGHILANLSDTHENWCGNLKTSAHNAFEPPSLAKAGRSSALVNNVVSFATPPGSKADLPWGAWIEEGTPIPTPKTSEYSGKVGAFKGECTNQYRPMMQCKMRNVQHEFCHVCREALLLSFYKSAAPIDTWNRPKDSTTTLTNPTEFRIHTIQDPEHFDIQWQLNGTPFVPPRKDSVGISDLKIEPGSHEVQVVVKDTTSWIQIHPGLNRISDTLSWSFELNADGISAINTRRNFSLRKAATPGAYLKLGPGQNFDAIGRIGN